MGPTANARIDSEHFSGQDQLSTTQHAGVQFTKFKNKPKCTPFHEIDF